jgi:hypothetical protein
MPGQKHMLALVEPEALPGRLGPHRDTAYREMNHSAVYA